jgi:glucokinase
MDNEIKRGGHFLVGEVGHMIINPASEEICACGGKGCFEAMVSTRRIIRMAKEKYDRYPDSLVFNGGKPDEIDIYNIFNASAKYDELALELIDDAINWFAIGISNIILLYDPQIIPR